MSDTFQTVIRLSRQGASLLAKGDTTASILSLRSALTHLKSLVDGETVLPSLQSWRITTMPVPHEQGSHSSNNSTSCELFSHCFLIMPMPCHEKVPTHDKYALLSAALLFNVALAYHLRGPLNDSQRIAMNMYAKAANLLQRLDITSDGSAVMLAICNNMAAMALEDLDLQAFAVYRQTIGSYLSITETTGAFYLAFFAGNFAATEAVHQRPAPAA